MDERHRARNGGKKATGNLKLAYGRKEAAGELSVSPRMIDYLITRGELRARKLGRRVLIPGTELLRIICDGLPRGNGDQEEAAK